MSSLASVKPTDVRRSAEMLSPSSLFSVDAERARLLEQLEHESLKYTRSRHSYTRSSLDGDSQDAGTDSTTITETAGDRVRVVRERLAILRQLDWLHVVSQLTGPEDPTGTSSSMFELYVAVRARSPVDVAASAARSLHLSVLTLLFEWYPYTLHGHALEVLALLPVSCPVREVVRLLGSVGAWGEGRRTSARVGMSGVRAGDWAEEAGRMKLLEEHELTEHALRSRSNIGPEGLLCLHRERVEQFELSRACALDEVGLVLDAVQFLEGCAREEAHSVCAPDSQSPIVRRVWGYVGYVVLCGWVQERMGGVVERASMREWVVMEGQERVAAFLEVCLLVTGEGREGGDDMRVLRHEHLGAFLREHVEVCGGGGVDADSGRTAVRELLAAEAYGSMEWVLAFVRSEALDPAGPVVSGSVEGLGQLCRDVLRREPNESTSDSETQDVETVLNFQVLLSEVLQELAETYPENLALGAEVANVNSAFRVSALMDQLGLSVELVEAFRLTDNSRSGWDVRAIEVDLGGSSSASAVRSPMDVLCGAIEARFAEGLSGRGWSKLHATLVQLVRQLCLAEEDTQALFELGCQCCLRLGHVAAAEAFLEDVEVSKREGIVISCAHDVLETSDSAKTAKRILALLPESERSCREVEFVDTVERLRSQGIDISLKQVRKSSNVSQLFRNAICNVTTTKGLQDVDAIVGLSESLNTGLSRNDVLMMLADTAFALQDASLCNQTCVEMVDAGAMDALPLLTKVVESAEFLERLDDRGRIISFALMAAQGERLLKLLSTLRERDRRLMGESSEFGDRRGDSDPRTAVVMMASIVSGQDIAQTRCLLDARGDMHRADSDRSFYVGAMCGVAIKVISTCVDEANPSELLDIPLSVLCQWACVCLEQPSGSIPDSGEYVEVMRRLGACLVAVGDKRRVSVINDKSAEDLWATGDVNAQRFVIMQMTDKVAAGRVSQFGTIEDDALRVSETSEVGVGSLAVSSPLSTAAQDLTDVMTLAHRCETTYDDIEGALVRGVLYRHGSTSAFGDAWASFSRKHPGDALDMLFQFTLEHAVGGFVNNAEVIRVLGMLERIANVSDAGVEVGVCLDTAELFKAFDRATNGSLSLGHLLRTLVVSLRGDGGDGNTDQGDSQWCLDVTNPHNAKSMYSLVMGLKTLWPNAHLVDPMEIMLSAWSKSGWNLDMLEGLEPALVLELGTTYVISRHQLEQDFGTLDLNLLEGVVRLTKNLSELPERKELVRTTVELSIRNCQSAVGTVCLPDSAVDGWTAAVTSVKDGTQDMSDIVHRLSSALTGGASYLAVTHIARAVEGLLEGVIGVAADDLVRTVYNQAICMCTRILRAQGPAETVSGTEPTGETNDPDNVHSSNSTPMSVGEAVQSILAIVQSLDSQIPEESKDSVDELRTLVYCALKDYLADASLISDVVHSEVQIQLVEMMMALGRHKWAGWNSEEQDDHLHIPVYSRLVSHFSTTWGDALNGLDPTDFTTPEYISRSVVDMARRADDLGKAMSLWDAVKTILLGSYQDDQGGDKRSNMEYNELFRASALDAATTVISRGGIDDVISSVDDFTFLFGDLPQASWDAIDARVSAGLVVNDDIPATSALLHALFRMDEAAMERNLSIVTIVPLLRVVRLGGSVAIALVAARAAPRVSPRDIKAICVELRDNTKLDVKITAIDTNNGAAFKCPIRVLVFAHLIAQLMLSESHFARAAYVTFEFMCLVSSLRLQDSAANVIETVLSGVATMEPDVRKTGTELREIEGLCGKRTLARILREAPSLCADALKKL